MSDITAIIKKLRTSIDTAQANLPKPKKNKKGEEVETPNTVALTAVLEAMGALSEYLMRQQEEGVAGVQVDKKLRQYEDDLDDSRQQNLKGNFVLTSRAYEDKVSMIKEDADLGNESLLSHVIKLVQEKLGVVLPEGDVSGCYRLQNGSVVLRVWNRKNGSAYDQMVNAIKSGKNFDLNLFFNFQLTRKRNSLLYEVRQMKKAKKIAKFYTDEHGNIKVLVKLGDKQKVRITSVTSKECPILKTFTIQELKNVPHQ